MPWSNQVAVVTGGSRGIGRGTALLLARRGAAVCVNYAERAAAAEAVVHEIRADGGRAIAIGADVANEAAVKAMIERATSHLGPVTILVNNAGIFRMVDELERMRQVNVDGIIHTTRAVMGDMQARGYGRIINVASVAALGTAMPGNTFYAATKAMVLTLTRRFAMELGPHGITVNSVVPGFVPTEMSMTGHVRTKEQQDKREKWLAARSMVGRAGRPQDIANAVAFLASPESSWITAQRLIVDGGRMDYIGHG
jgi:3-oxoacyl-[acyl-carrier protein] reductase